MNGQSTYNLWFLFCQYVYFHLPTSLFESSFWSKPSLGPGSKGLARKKYRRGKNSSRRPS